MVRLLYFTLHLTHYQSFLKRLLLHNSAQNSSHDLLSSYSPDNRAYNGLIAQWTRHVPNDNKLQHLACDAFTLWQVHFVQVPFKPRCLDDKMGNKDVCIFLKILLSFMLENMDTQCSALL